MYILVYTYAYIHTRVCGYVCVFGGVVMRDRVCVSVHASLMHLVCLEISTPTTCYSDG